MQAEHAVRRKRDVFFYLCVGNKSPVAGQCLSRDFNAISVRYLKPMWPTNYVAKRQKGCHLADVVGRIEHVLCCVEIADLV